MKMYPSLIIGSVLSLVTNLCASAEITLLGKWSGEFNGVQIEIPTQADQAGILRGEPRKYQTPKFVKKTLKIEVENQVTGLAIGNWSTGEFKQQFVCAQLSASVWNCVDAGGRASLEVKSNTEMKVCYLDNREGAQGAGCAELRRTSEK